MIQTKKGGIELFFFFGLMPLRKRIPYVFSGICAHCEKAANYEVYLVGEVLSIFFIPIFTFHKQYLVRMSCCGNLYLIENALGKRIEKGEPVPLTEADLIPFQGDFDPQPHCPNCGTAVDSSFHHCPNCGWDLKK
ncbi:MAG TPA: zinc ribbon domain-containing protein [Firmicutes bacterium]|nr:zinc ribbon domain-containing protein [Bacillota bacterium]